MIILLQVSWEPWEEGVDPQQQGVLQAQRGADQNQRVQQAVER